MAPFTSWSSMNRNAGSGALFFKWKESKHGENKYAHTEHDLNGIWKINWASGLLILCIQTCKINNLISTDSRTLNAENKENLSGAWSVVCGPGALYFRGLGVRQTRRIFTHAVPGSKKWPLGQKISTFGLALGVFRPTSKVCAPLLGTCLS